MRCTARLYAFLLLMLAPLSVAGAQIRGGSIASPPSRWLLTLGASAAIIGDINDGATQSTFKFGSDPVMLYRAAIEKALDEATSIGVAVAYGKVDVGVVPFVIVDRSGGLVDDVFPRPGTCADGCDAQTDFYQALAQFRSGGGPGFHTFFEANGGVTSLRNMTTKTEGDAFDAVKGKLDLTGTLGAGFGYTLSQKLAITLVQDFGIGYHSKDDLPSGTSRTWRIRNTRAALRFSF